MSDERNESGTIAPSMFFLSLLKPGTTSWRSSLHRDFEFFTSDGGVSGWIRRDVSREVYRELSANPEAFVSGPNTTILKDRPKSRLFRYVVKSPDGARHSIVIKRVRYDSLFRRVGFLFTVSPALRSLRGALILQGAGLDTPLPIAAIEPSSWRDLGTSYYIAEELEDSESLRALWQTTLPALTRQCTLRMRIRVLKEVAALTHRLHSIGIYHQDLKGTNILLRNNETNEQRLFLVDVGDVTKSRRLLRRRRVRNLVQMCKIPGRFWLSREKALFLKHYADLCGLSKADRRALVHHVLATTEGRGGLSYAGIRCQERMEARE